jgi:hypothetical protein
MLEDTGKYDVSTLDSTDKDNVRILSSTSKDNVSTLDSTDKDNVRILSSTSKDNVSMLNSTGKDGVSILSSMSKDSVSMTNDLSPVESGNSPQSSIMMASFRIDRETWAKFGAIAKRERLTATDVLTDYIQRCTDNDKTEYAVSINTDNNISTDTYDTDKLNDAVLVAVSTLSLLGKDDVSMMISTELESLRAEIEQLKKFDAIG